MSTRPRGRGAEEASVTLRGGFAFVPWEPDCVTADQWASGLFLTPERRLLFAVLENAIVSLRLPDAWDRRSRTIRAPLARLQAEAWFVATDEDDPSPFTFVNLCGYLALDADSLRARVCPPPAPPAPSPHILPPSVLRLRA